MTQVTGNIPQFEFRRIWLYPSKTTSVFNYCLLPHLLSEQSDAWITSKVPGRNRGHESQHNRWSQVLSFEGVTLATTLTVSHNGLHFMSPFQEAHWSAEKKTQCSALKHPTDGLVWSQKSMIILKNKRSWIDMLTSFSWWEAGKVGFYSCQPREDLASFVHLNSFYGADEDHTQYG